MPFRHLDEARLRKLTEIGANVVSNLDLESLLRQIVDNARAMTGARYAALGILDASRGELERFITSGIDDRTAAEIGPQPKGRGVLGMLIKHPEAIRMHRVEEHAESFGFPEHHPVMQSFLGVPIMIDGQAFGNLYLADKQAGDFDAADQAAVETLAMWAGIAIGNARSVREDRLRAAIAASEHERHRWALELHDETLQGMGALRLLLSAAQRSGDSDTMKRSIDEALEQLSLEITGLRGLITELRPAALDSLGLEAALETLATRAAGTGDFNLDIDFHFDALPRSEHATEQEITAYRLVQESLSNAAKHSRASQVSLTVRRTAQAIEIEVADDGTGFDTGARASGFGLPGMRERVALTQGELSVASVPGEGTTIKATLPAPAD